MGSAKLAWAPYESTDPGPCIKVIISNSADVINAGRSIGLEYPPPRQLVALLDTGASVTVVSKAFANHCKLFQTAEGSEITAIGQSHRCGEHAASVSFPGTNLKGFDPIRIVSAVFVKERHYACLIGRDILRNWNITFDGRNEQVLITD